MGYLLSSSGGVAEGCGCDDGQCQPGSKCGAPTLGCPSPGCRAPSGDSACDICGPYSTLMRDWTITKTWHGITLFSDGINNPWTDPQRVMDIFDVTRGSLIASGTVTIGVQYLGAGSPKCVSVLLAPEMKVIANDISPIDPGIPPGDGSAFDGLGDPPFRTTTSTSWTVTSSGARCVKIMLNASKYGEFTLAVGGEGWTENTRSALEPVSIAFSRSIAVTILSSC